MKQSVIKLVCIFFLIGSLTSCNEEEFFEKDAIETFKDQNEIPDLELDISVDDDSNPDGPNFDDSNSDDSNSDDSNSDDSNSDDSNSDDSNSDDSNSDDSNSDDSNSGDNSTSRVIDIFIQTATTQNKVDILWVIDNSGSMADEQANLAQNFETFINKFADLSIDFKMSITTTDTKHNNAGRPVQNSLEELTSSKLAQDKNLFINNFQRMIQVGTSGSWREKGIKASEIFSNQFANRYFREDAYFAIIYVSDEEDQSEKLISNHLEQISKWKKNKNLVKAYSIVDTNSTPKVINGYSYGSQRYQAISNLTGGTISDIKSNFYNSLLNISSEIVELTKSFPLTRLPKSNSSIQVKVDGLLNTSWIYDQQTKTIKFNLGLEPIVSQKIEVIYEVES